MLVSQANCFESQEVNISTLKSTSTHRSISMWMLSSTTCVVQVAERELTRHVEAGSVLAGGTSPLFPIPNGTSMITNAEPAVVKLRTIAMPIK